MNPIGRRAAAALALLPLSLAVWLALRLPDVAAGAVLEFSAAWAPAVGLDLAFRLDGLALLFALIVTAVAAPIFAYSCVYLEDERELGRFLALMLLFMASMLGLVLAANVIAMFVFWELTSLASFLLIAFHNEQAAARNAALKSLMVTAAGGQALLFGLLLLGFAAGSFDAAVIIERAGRVRAHPAYAPGALLVLIGAFTKSAQVPFHFWLPAAMAAPTPVSAYLHSAAMVNAGIYLIARLSPALAGTVLWQAVIVATGGATLLIGAVQALRHDEYKQVLAYATISALGAMTMLLGLGSDAAIEAALLYLLVHVLYKAPLFLVAGAVEHETGATRVTRMRGLGRAMPYTAAAAAMAALTMAGIPPLLGSAGKEGFYEALLGATAAPALLTGTALLATAVLVGVAVIVGVAPFAGRTAAPAAPPHAAPLGLWLPTLVLAGTAALLGLAPALTRALLDPAVAAAGALPGSVPIGPIPHAGAALLLGAISVVAGAGVYLARRQLRDGIARLHAERWGPDRLYELGVRGSGRIARVQTNVLQHGYLRFYFLTLIGVTVVAASAALIHSGAVPFALPGPVPRGRDVGAAALLVVGAIAAARASSMLRAAIALAVVGLGEALVYMLSGAPDVAMAQVLAQTLTAVILVTIVLRIGPAAEVFGPIQPHRLRDAGIAIAGGAIIAVLTLIAAATQPDREISAFYAAASVPRAGARNIVNTILIDFRALDTIGELTVLATAAVGVALLVPRTRRSRRERIRSVIVTTTARVLTPLLVLFSFFLLLRGADRSGGGFPAGLVAATALVVYSFAFGARLARRILRVSPVRLIAFGLLLLTGSGIPAVLRGDSFLTAVHLGDAGGVEFGTPLLFELGVYFTVIGAAFTVFLSVTGEDR